MVHFAAQNTQPGGGKTVADILTAAAELIDRPGAWIQGQGAKTITGEPVDPTHERAAQWCAWGAIERVTNGHRARSDRSFHALLDALDLDPDWDPAIFGEVWNDAPERTQAEVVAALRAAAENARTADEIRSVGTEEPSGDGVNPQSPQGMRQ